MTQEPGPAPGYPDPARCRVSDLEAVVSETTGLAGYPHASAVGQNVLVYDGARVRAAAVTPDGRRAITRR